MIFSICITSDTYLDVSNLAENRTYVVSSSIVVLYYTQLIGDAREPPTLLATSGFNSIAVIGQCHPKYSFPLIIDRVTFIP